MRDGNRSVDAAAEMVPLTVITFCQPLIGPSMAGCVSVWVPWTSVAQPKASRFIVSSLEAGLGMVDIPRDQGGRPATPGDSSTGRRVGPTTGRERGTDLVDRCPVSGLGEESAARHPPVPSDSGSQ